MNIYSFQFIEDLVKNLSESNRIPRKTYEEIVHELNTAHSLKIKHPNIKIVVKVTLNGCVNVYHL